MTKPLALLVCSVQRACSTLRPSLLRVQWGLNSQAVSVDEAEKVEQREYEPL